MGESFLGGGSYGTFAEAFPQIASVEVIVEMSATSTVYAVTLRLDQHSIRQRINCHNRSCHGGGVPIVDVIGAMVAQQQTHLEGSQPCRGSEGSPKGRRRHRACLVSFKYTIDIVYKV
jgi:hypothetical protein